jgi:hypothetical protein
MQHTPPPQQDTGAPLRWLFAAVGLALVMVVSASIAAFSVGALSGSEPTRGSEADDGAQSKEEAPAPKPIPKGLPYVATAKILGGTYLKLSNVRGVVESYKGGLVGCYQEALQGDPRLAGDLTLMINVDADGHVSSVMSSALSVPDRTLRSCCEALASDWTFLPPEGSTIASFMVTLEFGRR